MEIDYYDYKALLKRAREQIPEYVYQKDRFELPEIELLIEGNRTIIRNFKELAKAMNRDMEMLAKYLFKETGSAGSIEGNRLILQRRINPELLKARINDFLREYVLCKECGKPDTKIIKEGRIHLLKCTACGAIRPIRMI
ncbi:translation initiation factor IF-2 subunit beta [Methanocaldococcus villosus KIN24-T80]|uniref:Translation initiation factor 2 subunit beta n=1 Tax=Methanocaldococcus villosus KIN24-T80 TaxID=1069083 RepID=N6W027_9EURY|nr:translation initiation factor IF-2 subunit beta [Methanocaldococcus villosus]ENN96707.1 translation initiation factor IF-2 subunit beta [Methanocaldococcus villosus KIN24-T80]